MSLFRIRHTLFFAAALVLSLYSSAHAQPGMPPSVIQATPAGVSSGELTPQLTAMFGSALLPASVTPSNFIITGSRSGRHVLTVTYNADEYTASLQTARPFIAGETIQAVVRSGGVQARLGGKPITRGYAWKFTTGAQNGTCEFSPDPRAYTPSGSPSAVAAADFNKDGATDLVCASASGQSIDVYLNTTRQQFVHHATFSAGGASAALATADFNGDGAIDIASAGPASISIFLNDGAGTFTLASSASAGSSISAIAASDLDNDGATDLAVTNAGDNTVTFLKNDGNGSFSILQTAAVGKAPSGIALEDLNHDGLTDALVCNRQSNDVWVLKNSGAVFAKDSVYQIHRGPSAIVSFDFDNDGYMDLAAANSETNDVSVMLNNKEGRFIGPGDFDLVGNAPVALAGGDFDGDGDIDLAVACAGSNTVAVMQNNGYSFPTVKSIPCGSSPAGIAAVEMSGVYGILDIASANEGSGTISILKNTFFTPPPAKLTLSESSLTFGETAVGSSTDAVVQMSADFSPLTIDSISSSSGQFTALQHLPLTIGSFAAEHVAIGFSPRAFGTVEDVVTVYSSAGAQQIAVTGSSPVPTLSVPVQSASFGDVKLMKEAAQKILITNPSLNDVSIDSLVVSGSVFRAAASKRTIAQHETLTVSVFFAPQRLQHYQDTLLIANTSDRRMIPIALSGNSPVPTVSLSARMLSYGNVKVARSSVQTLVLKNPSLNDVVIDSAHTASRVFLPAVYAGRIASGDSLALAVAFQPGTLGDFSDTLRLHTNTTTPEVPIALSGNSPVPSLIVSASGMQFGNVRTGDTATAKITLSNLSFNDVVIDTIAAGTRSFRPAVTKCRIAQSDSLVFTVRFTPDELRTYADTIRLSTNSDRRMIPITLWGNSPVPDLTLSQTAIDFATVPVRKPVTKQIMLSNGSLNTVKIDSLKLRTRVFTTGKHALPLALKTGDTTSITVTFLPDSTLQYADTLFLHSSTLRAPAVIVLSGRGESATGVTQLHAGIPQRYALNQNYPNPFNPVTTMQFAAPQPSFVTIKVYDVTGREIAEVFRNSVMPGYFSVQWNAQGISSGMYLYRMRAVSAETGAVYTETRKLVILK
ncbi:MAG: FG-GAP-like repeat-containing protein [Acidobacteriota bacterium]